MVKTCPAEVRFSRLLTASAKGFTLSEVVRANYDM